MTVGVSHLRFRRQAGNLDNYLADLTATQFAAYLLQTIFVALWTYS